MADTVPRTPPLDGWHTFPGWPSHVGNLYYMGGVVLGRVWTDELGSVYRGIVGNTSCGSHLSDADARLSVEKCAREWVREQYEKVSSFVEPEDHTPDLFQ